jgi:NAD(P)-dependent dehydrogenase (short-subunit alcohol dehydrogenase family)
MDLQLKGRKAIVTGASRGIGAAIANGLAAEGVDVALFSRDPSQCAALATELETEHGVKAPVVALDLLEPARIRPAVEEGVAALGGSLDILVNNAGGATRGSLFEVPDEAWDENFIIKPIGLMRMSRECAPYLEKSDQARIVNLSGTRGREPAHQSTLAGPINMGTNSATKVLANLLGPKGITVNAICPGSTNTRRWDELVNITMEKFGLDQAGADAQLCKEVPLGCVIRVEDIADCAVFLASGRASRISGTAINVDGGRTRSI